jgi:undecaprenyl-diphosphatase
MQAGNVLAVGVAAAGGAATRRFWLAANLAITGVGVWLAARLIKDQVGRGGRPTCSRRPPARPPRQRPRVRVRARRRGRGHRHHDRPLPGPAGPLDGVLVACLVCVSRMYVGAHLPLDVVGGAALAGPPGRWSTSCSAPPAAGRRPERAAKALREQGLEVAR